MSTEFKTSSETVSPSQQRRQATVLLLRLQWLLIFVFIAALLWLYISQQRFEHRVNERLQNNEQLVTRLNEVDDRLFAINQQTLPAPNSKASNQAQNQLELLRLQMQAVDRLVTDNNYQAATELLRGLQWQLSQNSNEIVPALTMIINQSLTKDIERLQAQSSQPSPWQLQNLGIQNIQEFLHRYERIGQSTRKTLTADNSTVLTRQQITIHEVIMTLNLAMQASNMREREQLLAYLKQARQQLQTVITHKSAVQTDANTTSNNHINSTMPMTDAMQVPTDITQALAQLDALMTTAPASTPLLTTQILDERQSKTLP